MDNSEKILVADENNVLLTVVFKMLSLLGYELSSADSGENGLNVFRKSTSTSSYWTMICPGWMKWP